MSRPLTIPEILRDIEENPRHNIEYRRTKGGHNTKSVCIKCRKDWEEESSPHFCRHCGEISASVYIKRRK